MFRRRVLDSRSSLVCVCRPSTQDETLDSAPRNCKTAEVPAATQTSRRLQHSNGRWPNLKGRIVRSTSTTSNQRHRQDEQKCNTRDPGRFSSSERWWQKQGNQRQRQQGKGTGKAEYVIGTGSRFDDPMASAGVLQRLHKRNQNTPVFCHNFQSRRCQDANCQRFHACAGCNTANVPYADCLHLGTA